MFKRQSLAVLAMAASVASAADLPASNPSEALTPWAKATIEPVLPDYPGHSLHTYFGISPESPDGQSVLVYVSEQPDAHHGQIWLVQRQTGKIRVIADSVHVEDAHRQANQHWVAGGRFIVYMDLVDDDWLVVRVDVATMEKTVLARGRQLGWGQPDLDVVPLYGPHWAPGDYRDLEMLNVRTGDIETVLKAASVVEAFSAYVQKRFGSLDRTFSIFFPTLSPDGKRVFFKIASPRNGKFRSGGASDRDGLFVADLEQRRMRGMVPQWNHPAWFSDSRRIIQRAHIVDTDGMKRPGIPRLAPFEFDHASTAPDGHLAATDSYLKADRRWLVALIDLRTGHYQCLHLAPATGDGTRSWRRAHPHPSFNAAGNRLYFNVMEEGRTVLCVAEAAQ